MRDLHISAVLNGYIVRVDCQQVVFTSKHHMLSELRRYFDNPAEVEEDYLARFPAEIGASAPPTPRDLAPSNESLRAKLATPRASPHAPSQGLGQAE